MEMWDFFEVAFTYLLQTQRSTIEYYGFVSFPEGVRISILDKLNDIQVRRQKSYNTIRNQIQEYTVGYANERGFFEGLHFGNKKTSEFSIFIEDLSRNFVFLKTEVKPK